MSEKNEKQPAEKEAELAEQSARVRELRSKVEKELLALLAHPLVPQEFKDVFEGKK